MGKESPHPGFAPASDLHVEVDELTYSTVWVVVSALRRRGLAEHIAE